MPPERPFGRWGTLVYDGLGHVGGLVLAVMTGAIFVQVVLRYVFNTGIDGLDEVPRFLFVWCVMIGAASAMHRGEHTALDWFRKRMRPRRSAALLVLTESCGMLLFISMIYSSIELVPNSQVQQSAGLGLPLGYVYAAVPVGSALILLPMGWRLAAAVRELWRRRS